MSVTRQCGWCLNPFDEHQPRPPAEVETLRAALFITAPLFDPLICDACHRMVMETAPQPSSLMNAPSLLLRTG